MFGPVLDPRLVAACQEYAHGFSLSDETEEKLPENRGLVRRMRVTRGEEAAIRTEIRSMLTDRVIVDVRPLGAVLILLEISKRRTVPRRLVVLTGDRAGEYTQGAIEAAWGAVLMEGSRTNPMGERFPVEPRRLTLPQVIELAETVLDRG